MAPIQFHHAHFRAIGQATEVEEKVRAALLFAAGEEAKIEKEQVEGHHHNPIVILTAHVGQTARVRAFFERLVAVEGVREALLGALDGRMDDDGNVFLRLSKQEAFLGRLALAAEGDDPIHVKAKVATYPASGVAARARMRDYLTNVGTRKAI